MTEGVRAAIKCFDENRNLFGNPQQEPEKFNLYNGLAGLAEGIAQLQAQVATLTQEVTYLRSQLGR